MFIEIKENVFLNLDYAQFVRIDKTKDTIEIYLGEFTDFSFKLSAIEPRLINVILDYIRSKK